MASTAQGEALEPSSPEATPSDTIRDDGWEYRPHLDGLRAVAVYLVVAFHAGSHRLDGGFIGVDVFFVLSGYLVTQLLTRDLHGRGRIRLRRFYARRYRRLLPAAFATLLVTAAVYAAIATPLQVHDAIGGVRAAFLYGANWFFIGQSNNYFAANIATNPVIHFWSLSVEEQFYLLWPLLLGGMYLVTKRAGARQWDFVRGLVAIAGIASLVAALQIGHTNINRAYYGTDTRAYQLLAGAFIALSPELIRLDENKRKLARRLSPLLLIGIVLMATSIVSVGAITRGAIVTVLTCLFILALENADGGLPKRALSGPRVTYLGRISYGTYLWHWPVLVVATQAFHMSSSARIAIACLVASALAAISYEILEMPIRRSKLLDKINTQVIVTGLVISLVAGIVVVPRIMKSPHGAGTLTFSPGATNTGGIVPSNIDWQSARDDKVHVPVCLNRSVEVCVAVRGKKGGITLVGDSHARMLIPAFTRIAKRKGLTLSIAVMPDCPWQIGLQYVLALGVVHECEKRKADWYGRVIPQLDPDIVVLVNRAFDTSVQPLPLVGPKGEIQPHTSVYLRTIAGATAATVKQLRDAGHNVVMIEPVTVAPFDTLSCLSGAKTVDACRFIASARPTGVERYYRSIADNKHVWSIDIDRLVCPYLPICDPIVNGIVVRRDNSHITAQFSESISNQLQTLLEQEGVFGG